METRNVLAHRVQIATIFKVERPQVLHLGAIQTNINCGLI